MEDKQPNLTTSTGKPLQAISWSEKNKEDKKWFKDTAEYYIARSKYGAASTGSARDGRNLHMLYEVYNSKFPLEWFEKHTNPLNAADPKNKQFPAKIRPISILRTNLDLLMSEYPRRPFVYQVNNLSDDSYSRYQEELKKTLEQNVTQHFQTILASKLMEQGLITEDGKPASEEALAQIKEAMSKIEFPQDIKEKFQVSYKDNLAIQGQKWLTRLIQEQYIRPKLNKMFKHWIIAGEAYSYKSVEFDQIVYRPISPLNIDFDKASDTEDIEDGEWVVALEEMTISDAVDRYYEELAEEASGMQKLEQKAPLYTPGNFFDYLSNQDYARGNKIRVHHVVWKGKKKVKVVMNLQTGEESIVDEDYTVDKTIEKVTETFWVNEIYEATRLMPNWFVRMRAFPYQRNSMNNFSKTKLPYNGRKMSDLHAQNVSVLELGLPIQIMFIIVTYLLEKTLAKSKGKIVMIDQNAIPTGPGWTEERFFYYGEAMGYFLLNRNQIGVDKSFNQYQVLDMSLFDQIKELINYQSALVQQWDDLIGISRQRKGQTYASDLVGVNERATFQSTVVTDTIFNRFEEFVEKELQGLLDLSKFTALDGIYKAWNSTEVGNQLLEIEPTEYCSADLGIFVQSSSEAIALKNKIEANAQAMLQNNVKASTIISILRSQNIAELEAKLLQIEEEQAKAEQEAAQSEQDALIAADERREQFEEFMEILRRGTMHEEYDRKEDLEEIKGTYNTFTFQDGDSNDNGVPDAAEIQKILLEKEKVRTGLLNSREERRLKANELLQKAQIEREKMKSQEKIAKMKPKPKPASKK